MNSHGLLGAAAVALGLALASPAVAQGTAPVAPAPDHPVKPQPRDPNMPSAQNTVPEKIDRGATTGSTKTLSDRLEQTGGVITPPAGMDPEIKVTPPVPNPGTMPVIPPPGSPGGNPNVQPK